MVVPDGEWEDVGRDAHAVIDEAKTPASTSSAAASTKACHPFCLCRWRVHRGWLSVGTPAHGGFTVLELPSREEAIAWAARIAKACRCEQELRVFQFDPHS